MTKRRKKKIDLKVDAARIFSAVVSLIIELIDKLM